jgi:hypothetical protein
MQQEDDQKCEKMKDEINGHCQEVGSSYSRGRDLVYIFNEFQDGACSREDTQVVDKERLEKFFRSALDASRRMNEEIKRSNCQREQLLGEFGAETVNQWKEEHNQLEFLSQLEPTSSS